jgi:DNA-binding NarL/FixJ family response regulator
LQGRAVAEIARELRLSPGSVRAHLSAVRRRDPAACAQRVNTRTPGNQFR